MTSFTLTGPRGRAQDVSITWTDGVLSGDDAAVAMVRDLAAAYEGKLVGPSGTHVFTRHHHLASPYSAWVLMHRVFAGRPTQTGSLPSLPPSPHGAMV